ncbi:MAG: efflux transporter outer membrane subunit [Raineya sp.]|jgi:NodT family efflux transporter outer membrane factor (OMF) lipoprotein|nr:efflux transporter outer membrane subunit [Raineya sp.]
MIFCRKNILLVYSIVYLLSVTSCSKVFTPIKEPSKLDIPENFFGKNDSTSVVENNWKTFFKDPFLVQLIEIALVNNKDLQIALQKIEKSKADVLLAKGYFLPSVNGVISAGVDKYGDYTMNGVGNFDTNLSGNIEDAQRIPNPTPDFFLGFRSSWEIDIWGKLKNNKKMSLARLLANEEGKKLVVTEIVTQIALLYYQLLALDTELEVIQKNIALQEQALKIIGIQKEAGKATELAVKQSSALLLRTRSLEFILKTQIIQLENQINFLLGRFPQEVPRSKDFPSKDLLVYGNLGIPSQMLRQRPDIRQAEWELQAAQTQVKVSQAMFLPSLNINASLGFNAFKSSLLFNPASLAYGLLGGLTAPLLQYNSLKSNKKVAIASYYEAHATYQKNVLRAFQEVHTFVKVLENLEKAYELRKNELEELTKAVSTSQDLFVAGYANYLELITAQKSVLEAELDLFDIRRDHFLFAVQLYRALGGGWK